MCTSAAILEFVQVIFAFDRHLACLFSFLHIDVAVHRPCAVDLAFFLETSGLSE